MEKKVRFVVKGLFTVNEFSDFSRTTRDTLIYYDKIGLLTPMSRGNNNYRYYSGGQLAVINLIRTLQELGMSLEEIKGLKDDMTPALVIEVLEQQKAKIDRKIAGWERAQKLLFTLIKIIDSAMLADESKITIEFMPEEAIILGDANDYSHGRNDYDALLSFYHDMHDKNPDLNLNYPVWGVFSKSRVGNGDWVWPDRYYFYNPEGRDKKPAALYAIGYIRGGYGQSDKLYRRIIDYIDRNGFEICGDAYEEYPLNEVCITDDKDYLMRVMITVREKKSGMSTRF